ncbi:MAG: NUDIX domain-containing protein [Bacteroidota bacterium]
MHNYIRKIREKIGNELLLHPAARIIVENDQGEFLCIKRSDNGNHGLPAGGLEENETILQCIIREVREETGIEIEQAEVIGIASDPEKELMHYPNGDRTQYCVVEFYAQRFSGQPRADGVESTEAFFIPFKHKSRLPLNEQATFDSLDYYKRTGSIRVV